MQVISRRISVLASGVVALAAILWISTQSNASAPVRVDYKLAAVDRGPISQIINANGNLQPVSLVSVGAAVSGTVQERLVDYNDQVRKGQVLLRLNPANFQARVRQARAQVESAQARLSHASSLLQRNDSLLQQGFIPRQQRDQSQRDFEVAQSDLALAVAQLDAAQTDLDNCVIRSPIDGVIIKRSADVGQTVAASFQTPELFQIARDLKQMVIQTNVSEADAGLIAVGQGVRFSVDAFPARDFEGRVEQFRLNANNNQGVVTYTVIVQVDNSDGLLKPGMTAQTQIVVAQREHALRLPSAALRFKPDDGEAPGSTAKVLPAGEEGGAGGALAQSGADDGALYKRSGSHKLLKVYTADSRGALREHEVTVGISNTRYTELLSGDFKPGDEVIVRRAQASKKP